MDITQEKLDGAALVLVVDEHGRYEFSSTRSDSEVAGQLERIAEVIRHRRAKRSA